MQKVLLKDSAGCWLARSRFGKDIIEKQSTGLWLLDPTRPQTLEPQRRGGAINSAQTTLASQARLAKQLGWGWCFPVRGILAGFASCGGTRTYVSIVGFGGFYCYKYIWVV